ncbi:serine hydrolase [Streptomyces sp. TRM64462]|uniref:serine hydrolase n=1 Tax=Streptomyces sp. TRM64462 TaxID=2741726 RepID=UPI001585FD43|nr:serine hydrolase [Streptomyces sp. TRM64462]
MDHLDHHRGPATGTPARGAARPRRARATAVRALAAVVVALLGGSLLAGCDAATRTTATGAAPEAQVPGAPTSSPSPSLSQAPPAQPPPRLAERQVRTAVGQLDGLVGGLMRRTGVPGVAVSVVHRGEVIHQKGYGVRRVGEPDKVDADTVFALASLSKPLASTVVAGVVGRDEKVAWDDPVVEHDPGFALRDPWVSERVTIEDLFAHRSGLPDHAGDLLEDLGYDQAYILRHLREQPLAPFRATYAYTNMGLTAAAVAVARARGTTWEALSSDVLYKPLGMDSTSSRFADYEKAGNKAALHVPGARGVWRAEHTRDADAQSPAGGASSTVRDMGEWMKLQLADGEAGGRRVVDAEALNRTRLPHSLSRPARAPAGRSGFYGLGWNVDYDDEGRLKLSHSGAFNLGAATAVALLPSEGLGIVVLTNGRPIGVPETVTSAFLDIAQHGRQTVDWWTLANEAFQSLDAAERSDTDYTKPPSDAAPPKPASVYEGTYANPYYGPLTVRAGADGRLVMELGPRPTRFRLFPYDGDTFSYESTGENAAGRFGVTFTTASGAQASKVVVENLDRTGLGTFTRG